MNAVKKYYKLVRDRIPEIIEADGKRCIAETLSNEEYLRLLDYKLDEELAEYQESESLEELADLLEVIRAVVKARGWTMEELERVRAEKAAESELEYLTQTLKLDSKQNELLRQVLTDLAVKQLRIDENSDLKAARKSVMRTGLKLEKKSRLKAVFTKEQYKQYRRLDK